MPEYIAPEHLEGAAKSLTERANYAVRAKESSQVVLPPATAAEVARREGGLFRVSVAATRRLFIASELKSESQVRYVVDIRPADRTFEGARVLSAGDARRESRSWRAARGGRRSAGDRAG